MSYMVDLRIGAQLDRENIGLGICTLDQSRRAREKIKKKWAKHITFIDDCKSYVQKYLTYYQFYKMPSHLVKYYQPVSEVIPFARWGFDLIWVFLEA